MLVNEPEKYQRPVYLSKKKYNLKVDALFDVPRPDFLPTDFIITHSKNTFFLRWKHNRRIITHYQDGCYAWNRPGFPWEYPSEEYDNDKNWTFQSPIDRMNELIGWLCTLLNGKEKPRPFKELYSALRTLNMKPLQKEVMYYVQSNSYT